MDSRLAESRGSDQTIRSNQTLPFCRYKLHNTFMASSSSRNRQEDEEEGGGGRDWLELGLGFGNSKRCNKSKEVTVEVVSAVPPSSSSLQFETGLDLESRPKLGFGNEVVCTDTKYQDHHYCDCDDDDDGRFVVERQISVGAILNNNNYYYYDCSSTTRSSPSTNPAGFWFALRSSTNREGVRLPQIPKAYIRVKDASVSILLVKKYLVTKLSLSNEAEIDITCLGQSLMDTQTLRQVGDSIWIPKLMESFDSTTTSVLFGNLHDRLDNHHLMSLHYQKSILPRM